jgi:hypothetical protein
MYFSLYTRIFNPICLFLLITFLRFCLFGIVECFEFSDTIYIIDKQITAHRYQCWLVHEDVINYHLGLPDNQISKALLTAYSVNSSVGEVYVSQHFISQVDWNDLIARHPELGSNGLSCFKSYSTIGQTFPGPRDTDQVFDLFLSSDC